MNQFGRLEKVDLRTAWGSESGDFTPWLGRPENLDVLSETLGMDIEPVGEERPVGPYRADLVCRDVNTGELMLIENQLERTDHSHLGQILTYAAGLQAVTVVWIARRFTDEHSAALTWLNDHMDDKINLFGLEIELWKIGDSPAAPKFNVAVRPNDWIKSNSPARTNELSETKQLQQEFWAGFKAWVEDAENATFKTTKAQPQHWMAIFPFGSAAFHASFIINGTADELRVEVICRDKSSHKEHFRFLDSKRGEIETAMGKTLTWKELPGKQSSKIEVILSDANWQSSEDRDAHYQWLSQEMEQLIQVFKPHCQDAIEAVDSV